MSAPSLLPEKVEWSRDLYMEHPSVTARRDGEVSDWRYDHRIKVTGPRAPKPVTSFLEAAFPEFITAELEATGFERPTPIQSQSWPVALSGRDMIGLASTGSGKTLCFALPAMVHIVAQEHLRPGDGPVAVMLAPTRELAMQIKGECDRFGASSGVKNAAIFGGVPKGPQRQALRDGARVVVATPGCALWSRSGDLCATRLSRRRLTAQRSLDRFLIWQVRPDGGRPPAPSRPRRRRAPLPN